MNPFIQLQIYKHSPCPSHRRTPNPIQSNLIPSKVCIRTMKTMTTSPAAHHVAVVLAVMLAATAIMELQQLAQAAAIHPDSAAGHAGEADDALQYRHRRHRRLPIPSPPSSPAAPRPRPRPVPTPTPPPPAPLRFCNRTIVPEGVAPMSSSLVTAGDGFDCVPDQPTPRVPSPPPTPTRRGHCFCPRWAHPVFPGVPAPPPPATGGGSPAECVTALAGLMTCGSFLTGTQEDTPTPQSECCTGLGNFLNASSAAGDADRTLRCLCPVILGDVNKVLPKPMDPVRLMYLPIACGVVLPPQVLYICFTGGQQTPPPPLLGRIPDISGRIPDVLGKPDSDAAALSP